MAVPRNISAQRDFSAGEVDADIKRDDERPEFKSGLRQASNVRILNSRKLSNRCGRRVLFKETGRVDEIVMSGATFYLAFSAGTLRVYSAAGTQVFTESGRPWSNATAKSVVWAVYEQSIYICFAGSQPRVLSYDGTTWSTANYAETVTLGSQKRTAFYRISPKNITMQPAARTGSGIAVVFSAGMNLTGAHVGTRMRFVGRQIMITAVANATHATVTIEESLIGSQVLTFAVDPTPYFNIADEVRGAVSSSVGIITQINSGAKTITVQLLTVTTTTLVGLGGGQFAFVVSESVVGPGGSLATSAVATIGNPEPVTIWDDEVMNTLRGWPASCAVDQNRLIFCNFPAVPSGICWSAIGVPGDLYPDSFPSAAIFELVPNKATVYFVLAGPESNELVFTDNGLWYIPITVTSPLIPGSVVFNVVSSDACANVQPRKAQEFLVYINSGLQRVMAIIPIGAYNRPYATRDISDVHTHLINAPIALAAPSGDAAFPERYVYVLNVDGTVAVCKLATVEGMVNVQGMVGWTPWSGGGTVAWISARLGNVLFTSRYAPNSIFSVSVVEVLDVAQYLDAAMLYNTQPSGLPIPSGKGPLWWLAGGTVDLIDQTTRMMGTYTIDPDGFLIPQNLDGEDFSSATLVVGQAWSGTIEPFVPATSPGQSAGQRMKKRRVARAVVTVKNSTGFVFARLKSGNTIPGGPALGTVMAETRVPAWNQGDIITDPPPLREQSYSFRPVGRDNDPRVAVIKDTPGSLIIEEIGLDTSI